MEEGGHYEIESKLLDKYNTSYAITEEDFNGYCLKEVKRIFDLGDEPAIKIIKNEEAKEIRDKKGKYIGIDLSPCLFNDKELWMAVDITQKKGKIMDDFKQAIDYYRKYIGRTFLRDKKTTLDPWEIYDLHKKGGLSFPAIAKKLSGINEHPSYDPQVMKKYKAVKRAFKKAEEKIKK
jgi:hypothetical protein